MASRLFAACIALCALVAPAFAQEPPALPTTPEGWRAAALMDLDALRDLITNQTPIPYDTENARYGEWLAEGYAVARELAEEARDQAGYYYALARFTNGFGDPHIALNASQALAVAHWPGFVAASRNSGAVVTMRDESDPDAPPLGAQIVSCEGETLAALADARIFPYVMNARLAADRRRGVTRLFLDRAIPNAPPPARCLFSDASGERELALRWRDLPDPADDYWTAFQTASIGPGAEWGVTEPAPGVFWIGVPTFNSSAETSPLLDALINDVRARGEAMRAARAIVIDVRGNGGGNSEWADRLALAIFGAGPVREAEQGQGRSAVDWRASPENLAYWRAWIEQTAVRDFGADSEAAQFGREIVRGLEGALDDNPPLWRQGWREVSPSGGLTLRRPRGASPFPARVYMLSNGTCGSSCLNFADVVLQIPGVQLIGSATSGDGPYMEVRRELLPSGLASLTFPQKVWRGMGRGALEAYAPDVAYDGAWDDASVRAWVMALIETQSAAH